MKKLRIATILVTCALVAAGCAGGSSVLVRGSQDDSSFVTEGDPQALALAEDLVDSPSDLTLNAEETVERPDSGTTRPSIAGPVGLEPTVPDDEQEEGEDDSEADSGAAETTSSSTTAAPTSSTSGSTTSTTRAPTSTSTAAPTSTNAPTTSTAAPTTSTTTTSSTTTSTTTTTTTTTTTSTTTTTTIPAPDGGAIFAARCASCHGSNGDGFGDPQLNIQGLPAAFVATVVTNGDASVGMPSFSAVLTPEEIDAVAAYVESLP